jgi:DNA modification methylase
MKPMRKKTCVGPAGADSRAVKKLNSLGGQQVVMRPIETLKPFPGNARRHSRAQIHALSNSIGEFGFTNPVLIDENGTILCGHGRLAAAKIAGLSEVPTLSVGGLSFPEKRALVIADNRIGEQSDWDFDLLREQFVEILAGGIDIELSGYSTGEVDLIIDGKGLSPERTDPDDDLSGLVGSQLPVSRPDDLWHLGRHRLLCGDALLAGSYHALLGDELVQMVVTDPPYNVEIQGHAMGRGRIKHREFIMAAGEMSKAQFTTFLKTMAKRLVEFSVDGSIHYIFMDWRHLRELFAATGDVYAELKNLLVWNKSNGGQGAFYRSKHEMIAVFKHGTAAHINNFGLGGKGRYRTNVLDYPGVNSLHPARRGDLELHPTVKPVGLIADLIRDCSRRNGLILDAFGGSGTTMLAAERTGRRAALLELDPVYVDVAIRRFERATGIGAVHKSTGKTFAQICTERVPEGAPPASHQKAPGLHLAAKKGAGGSR